MSHWVTIEGNKATCDCGKWLSDRKGNVAVLHAWAVMHMYSRNNRAVTPVPPRAP